CPGSPAWAPGRPGSAAAVAAWGAAQALAWSTAEQAMSALLMARGVQSLHLAHGSNRSVHPGTRLSLVSLPAAEGRASFAPPGRRPAPGATRRGYHRLLPCDARHGRRRSGRGVRLLLGRPPL